MTDSDPTEYVLPLDDPGASLAVVGGKGASLARLAQAGLPVPPGFHVTTAAYRRFVAENDLQARIMQAIEPATTEGDPAGLDAAAGAIERLFLAAPVPGAVAEAVLAAYCRLAATPTGFPTVAPAGLPSVAPTGLPAVAVRSSATAEDLPTLSFAGQQETYLNIRGGDAVLEAVRRCWASLWTARAIDYRARHQIDPATVALAVVVQVLVPAESAGILFTANPLNGRRDQAMINAAWGLGEAIVGGQVTPDTWVVDRAVGKVLSDDISDKALMTVRAETGTVEQAVPEALRRRAVLRDVEVLELSGLGERIETLYGLPMDIEWARVDGQFAVLQARPITALAAPTEDEPESPAEWPLPNPKGKYARSSILELLPAPLTPLFATLGLEAINQGYNQLLFNAGDASPEMVLTINDYGYYNLPFTPRQMWIALSRSVFVLLPMLRTAETRWKGQARPHYAETVARWRDQDLAQLPARDLLRGAREIIAAAVDHYLSIQTGILPAAYMSEAVFTLFYDKLVRRADDPTALTFMLGFDSLPIRAEQSLYDLAEWARERPALARFLIDTPAGALAATLLPDAPAAPPADWAAFRARFAAHLERFGHAIYDLDFAKPVAADDPAPLLDTLKHLVQGQGANPHLRQQDSAARRVDAGRRIEARLKGLRLRAFRRLLDWAQRYAPLREDALGDVGLGWPLLRRMLRELGRRFTAAGAVARPDDVFWLTESEVDALAAGLDAGAASLPDHAPAVAERRARLRAAGRLSPPPLLPPKTRWAGLNLERWLPAKAGEQSGDTIRGIGASPGQVTATARVLRGPEDFGQMQHGDVLVAAITTPAWTPLFALASAVVTDVGGPLSHSSIVAREYGIPAVLGTGVATRRIRTGQQVKVDGNKGEVTLLP